jgi:MFS transporter, SP family, galactose:H+ symporter
MKVFYKSKNVFLSIFLISSTAIFFGAEQGFNSITVNLPSNVSESNYIFSNHNFILFFFIGCIVGIGITSTAAYLFGRKKTYLGILFFMLLTGVLTYHFKFPEISWLHKLISGSIAGSISFLAPLYIVEISSTKKRASSIAIYELMITLGILFVVVFYYFGKIHFLLDIRFISLPIVTVLILSVFLMKDSKTWSLVEKKRNDKKEKQDNIISKPPAKIRFKIILKVLFLGITIQALQQLSGINAMIYYSFKIFNIVGITNPIFTISAVVVIKTFATLLVINIIDHVDRKQLLYCGFTLMGLSMIFCSSLFYNHGMGKPFYFGTKFALLFCCLVYTSAFAMSIGPIAWLLCVEIFPVRYRCLGVAATTSTNWILNSIIIFSCMSVVSNYKISLIFLFFGVCCLVALFVVALFLPETRNVKFNMIEKNIQKNVKLKNIGEKEAATYEYTEF